MDSAHQKGIVTVSAAGGDSGGGQGGSAKKSLFIKATHTHTGTIGSTGGNASHENRPPFEAVIRWKRIN